LDVLLAGLLERKKSYSQYCKRINFEENKYWSLLNIDRYRSPSHTMLFEIRPI